MIDETNFCSKYFRWLQFDKNKTSAAGMAKPLSRGKIMPLKTFIGTKLCKNISIRRAKSFENLFRDMCVLETTADCDRGRMH